MKFQFSWFCSSHWVMVFSSDLNSKMNFLSFFFCLFLTKILLYVTFIKLVWIKISALSFKLKSVGYLNSYYKTHNEALSYSMDYINSYYFKFICFPLVFRNYLPLVTFLLTRLNHIFYLALPKILKPQKL